MQSDCIASCALEIGQFCDPVRAVRFQFESICGTVFAANKTTGIVLSMRTPARRRPRRCSMANSKNADVRTDDKASDLSVVGGVAAGAAAGSLLGPLGAAVGAVVGGVAGANSGKAATTIKPKTKRGSGSSAKKVAAKVRKVASTGRSAVKKPAAKGRAKKKSDARRK